MAIDLYWIYVNGHGGSAHNSGANDDGFFGNQFLYPGANAYFSTFGARIGGTFNVACGLDYNVEGAFQDGTSHSGGVDTDVSNFSVEAEIGLTFSRSNKFRIFARALFAEGPNDDGSDTGYLILYPNRHSNQGFRARYGLADLIPMTNVETVQVGFHFDPTCKLTLGATGLWAKTDQDITANGGDYGTELDVWGEWRYSQLATLGVGVAFVFPGDSGQVAWGLTDDTQFIGYIQTPLIF